MKLKKLFAGILAGAMVVGCMVMPSSAASTYTVSGTSTVNVTTTDNGSWYYENFELTTLFPEIAYVDDLASINITWNEPTGASWFNWYTVQYSIADDPWYRQYADLSSPYSFDVSLLSEISDGVLMIGASTDTSFTAVVDYTYTAYDDNLLSDPLTDTQLTATSYTVKLTSTSGRTATLTGTTYVEIDGDKYISVDVSEIPESEGIEMEVTFNY